jgi:hypothetical protein
MFVVERDGPPAVSGTEGEEGITRFMNQVPHPVDKANNSEGFDRGCTREGAHGAPKAVTSLSIEQRHF